jgi:hypothetical protein
MIFAVGQTFLPHLHQLDLSHRHPLMQGIHQRLISHPLVYPVNFEEAAKDTSIKETWVKDKAQIDQQTLGEALST